MAVSWLLVQQLVLFVCVRNAECGPIQGVDADWLNKTLESAHPETLEGLLDSDLAVAEGDLMLSVVEDVTKPCFLEKNCKSDRNAVQETWPKVDGRVSIPYIISADIEKSTSKILMAMKMVSEPTCVSFHGKEEEEDYIVFQYASGCSSHVGFNGGAQYVFVGRSCDVGNICHEILHTLGFYHEHTRMDRDDYITVIEANIIRGMESNFEKQDGNTFDIPYDIESILHYGSGFFSSNGLPTIVPKIKTVNMGQRTHLTDLDIRRVRLLYNCDMTTEETSYGG